MDIDHELSRKYISENHINVCTSETIDTPTADENESSDPKTERDVVKNNSKEVVNNIEEGEKSVKGGGSRNGTMWVMCVTTNDNADEPTFGPSDSPKLVYNPETNNSFVKWVMLIMLIMISLTAFFDLLVVVTPSVRKKFKDPSVWIFYVSALIILAIAFCTLFISSCARKSPFKFVILFLLVIALFVATAKPDADTDKENTLYVVVVAGAVVLVFMFVSFSKFDFTHWLLNIIALATIFVVVFIIVLVKWRAGVTTSSRDMSNIFIGPALMHIVLAMSMICCYVTVRYDTTIVLLAVMATAGVVFVCVLISCSRFDFTKWYLYIVVIACAFGMVSMVVSLYMLISGNYIRILHLVMLCAGTVISSIILVMELQMILGGKTIELSEDEYALGAFLLYTSIIDIFLKLVSILGILDD